jgi:hypothetical protein
MSDINSDLQFELLQEAFDGMFEEATLESIAVESAVADPGPPVPIDSHVVLLLGLGIVIAYLTTKRFRLRHELNGLKR